MQTSTIKRASKRFIFNCIFFKSKYAQKLVSLQFETAKIRVNSESEKKYVENFEHLFVSLDGGTGRRGFFTS